MKKTLNKKSKRMTNSSRFVIAYGGDGCNGNWCGFNW